jgi:hypothetical protein
MDQGHRPRPTLPVTLLRLALAVAVAVAGCGVVTGPTAGRPTPPPTLAPGADPVLVGAGDIAGCATDDDAQTAALLDRIPGVVFTAGDSVYESGSAGDFTRCYEPTWGRHRERTRPAPGNHDYLTPAAAGYFGYFGAAAGDPATGFYSFDLGSWHIVVLNSNCADVPGGCGPASPEEWWLQADLARHRARCTLAIWHHPRFSSGMHGSDDTVDAFWEVLYEAGADVVVNGHDHDYERFAPQTPAGEPDAAHGIREFVVGTGGAPLRAFGDQLATSEVRDASTHGVLALTLRPAGYDWRFVPVAEGSFTDSGTAACH